MKIKTNKTPPVSLNQKFLKEVPMVDASGNPIPQDQPLTSFWDKSKSTADVLKKKYRKLK